MSTVPRHTRWTGARTIVVTAAVARPFQKEKMTKTSEIHFRCPDVLREAIDAAPEPLGKDRTEKIVRALCKVFSVEYTKPAIGRPKATK